MSVLLQAARYETYNSSYAEDIFRQVAMIPGSKFKNWGNAFCSRIKNGPKHPGPNLKNFK